MLEPADKTPRDAAVIDIGSNSIRLVLYRLEGRAIWTVAQEKGIAMRTAAYVHALSRLAEAIEAHGTQSFFTT